MQLIAAHKIGFMYIFESDHGQAIKRVNVLL